MLGRPEVETIHGQPFRHDFPPMLLYDRGHLKSLAGYQLFGLIRDSYICVMTACIIN